MDPKHSQVAQTPAASSAASLHMAGEATEVPKNESTMLAQNEQKQDGDSAPKSLAEFEEQAYAKLSAKAKAKSKCVMKRPAAAAAKANASQPKVASKAKCKAKPTVVTKKGWKPASGVFGCLRCRGNIAGCDTCWSPLFTGQRFSSRKEWADFIAQKKKSQTKKK